MLFYGKLVSLSDSLELGFTTKLVEAILHEVAPKNRAPRQREQQRSWCNKSTSLEYGELFIPSRNLYTKKSPLRSTTGHLDYRALNEQCSILLAAIERKKDEWRLRKVGQRSTSRLSVTSTDALLSPVGRTMGDSMRRGCEVLGKKVLGALNNETGMI